jgi:hypothetical protein
LIKAAFFLLLACSSCFAQLSNYIGFPTNQTVIDAFTGSGALDAGIWDDGISGGAVRASNVLDFDTDPAAYIESAVQYATESEFYIDIASAGAAQIWYITIYVIYDSPTYENQFYIQYTSDVLAVHEIVAGVDNELESISVTLAGSDKIGFRRTDTFIEVWYDSGTGWTLMTAQAQSSLTGSFHIGIEFGDDNEPPVLTLDNFAGGKIRQAVIN